MVYMLENKTKIATEEWLFLLCYGVWFFFCCLYFTRYRSILPIAKIHNFTCWISLPLMIIMLIARRRSFSVQGCLLAAAFIAISVMIAVTTGSGKMPAYCMWIVAASYTDKKRILRVSFWVMLVCVILTVGAAYLQIIPNKVRITPLRFRQELGYRYPSYCSHHILILSMLFIAIRGRIRFPEMLLLLAANFIVYRATDTRADFAIALVILPALFLWQYLKFDLSSNVLAVLAASVPFLMAAGSIALHYFYDEENTLHLVLNKMLSGRLEQGKFALNYYSFLLFGQKLSRFIDEKYSFVDNYFLRALLKNGLPFLLFILSGCAKAVFRFCKKHEKALLLAMFGMLLHGLIDPEFGDIRWDPFIFYVSSLFEERWDTAS